MKYGIWKIAEPQMSSVNALVGCGYLPLTAMVLSARGIENEHQAHAYLGCDAPLCDPFLMKDMAKAADRVTRAIRNGEKIAVFGDYDVDGITATCLLTHFLRRQGADVVSYIPGRLEEGYGLNPIAIHQLHKEGVELIITVDCGITALEEAQLCASLGISLVITDHHECKDQLPNAAAVVDPHRIDATYPHKGLCGVGIAFKLAAALEGDQKKIAEEYCDLFCLGTIADVMPLTGENRRLVAMGLEALQQPKRLGVRTLVEACDCADKPVTASTIGYILAPRINAAGRMEHAYLAVELFLTKDVRRAKELAETLCRLNRDRQSIELEIYREASSYLKKHPPKHAIVLSGENWHQGVVGIVASRLCEEYCLPTFLICMSDNRGKASSRSYGGFNLFAALTELSDLLEGYGGHELAAGFTIPRENIDEFRRFICERAKKYFETAQSTKALDIDCELTGEMITEQSVEELSALEPCGTGCAKPVFCLSEAYVERVNAIGGGRHLRLRLRTNGSQSLHAVFFGGGTLTKQFMVGQLLDVAFQLNINEYHSMRSVQLNLLDVRPTSPAALYDDYCCGKLLSVAERSALRLSRADVTAVWRYLTDLAPIGTLLHSPTEPLCTAIAQKGTCSLRKILACLDVLSELGLVFVCRDHYSVQLRVLPDRPKNPLENSRLFRTLRGD